jgi:hypothetical protein
MLALYHLLLFGLLSSAALSLAGSASAVEYRFDFVSRFDAVSSPMGLRMGDPYSVVVNLGENPVDTNPYYDTEAYYRAESMAYIFPTGRFQLAPNAAADAQIAIRTRDDWRDSLTISHARMGFEGTFNGEPASMLHSRQIVSAITDYDSIWLDNDLPPLTFLDFELYSVYIGSIFNLTVNGVTGASVQGEMVGAAVIPEPNTAALFAIGLIALSCKARSPRRNARL